jgi:hypothetical protein
VVLGESTSAWSLYVALAIIICGYGLFKSNISCCGELYAVDDPRRDGGFRCCTPPATSAPSRPSPAGWRRSGTAGISALRWRESACLSA